MPIIVKALQKDGPDQPFKVVEIERRDPRPDDVVIDIKAAGICHSDIHTIRNEWGQAHFPLTVGHEIAGVVEAVGSGVTKYKPGDRVGVGCLVNSCGHCEQCEAGEEQACLNGPVGTYNSRDVDGTITQGGYSQKVVVNEGVCLPHPRFPGLRRGSSAAVRRHHHLFADRPVERRTWPESSRAGARRTGPYGSPDCRR